MEIESEALGYAIFGLGRFIDYRIKEGMPLDLIKPFMNVYLKLTAQLSDLEYLSYDELQSQKAVAEPEILQEARQLTPDWLPDYEKLRHHLHKHSKSQSMSLHLPQ